MEDEDNYWIPRTLDDPMLLLIWEFDVAALFISIFIFLSALGFFIAGVLGAYFACKAFNHLKRRVVKV